jgi:hypothetical protein
MCFSEKISVFPVISLAIRAQKFVSKSSGSSVQSSECYRCRQHHEIPIYLKIFLNKHNMGFKDLVFMLSKLLTVVFQYVYVFVHPLETSVFTCLQDALIM